MKTFHFRRKVDMIFKKVEERERRRYEKIALEIWKKKPAKYAEWYKQVGREIAAEIMRLEG